MTTRTPKLLGWMLVVGLLVAAWLPSSQQRATETASGQLSRAQLSPVSASERSLSLPESRKLASSSESFQAIETLRVGQRVLTGLASDANRTTAVDSTSWKKLSLKADYAWVDGTRDAFIVETLQPPEFLVHHSAEVGSRVPMPLDVQEMGCPDGLMAEVQSIEACPSIQDSPGRVILTTVAHLNSVGRTLTVQAIDGTTDQIHTTDYHPFWSETKQGWAQAYTLSIGDQLQGLGGRPLTLIATSRIPGVHTVYNLTVEHDHVYRVGISAVFVHNTNCAPQGGAHKDMLSPRPEFQSHHVIADGSTDMPKGQGAAVLMRTQDHKLTASYGSPTEIQLQREVLAKGKSVELFEKKIDEILQIAKNQPDIPDTFYDQAAIEAWDYFLNQGPTNYVPSTPGAKTRRK
jgi:Pretoxin HINT domain